MVKCGGGEVLGATRLGVLLRSMSLGADGAGEAGLATGAGCGVGWPNGVGAVFGHYGLKRGSVMSRPSVTASNREAERRSSPGAALVVILVFCMTLVPFWNYYVVWGCGSVMHLYSEFLELAKKSMDYAGSALIASVMIWRRASALSRYIIMLCVAANLFTLFVVTWQRLDALKGR